MEVKLYSRKVCFLVDTGSSLSLVSENIFESLPQHLILEELDTSLTTADGDLLSVQGKQMSHYHLEVMSLIRLS